VHERGEVVELEHRADGTFVHARVDGGLAHELAAYAPAQA
jgi:hypothetical protein